MNEEVTRVIMGYSRENNKHKNPMFSNVLGGRDEEDELLDVN